MLRKSNKNKQDINVALMYRNTPMKDTQLSPAHVILSSSIKNTMPTASFLLKPIQINHKQMQLKLADHKKSLKH